MSNSKELPVTKPVSLWNKPLSISFKDLFKSISKAAISSTTGNWQQAAKEATEAASSLGFKTDKGQIAWLLIFRSIFNAIHSLLEDIEHLIILNKDKLKRIENEIDLTFEERKISISGEFFKNPKSLPLLKELKKPLYQWLRAAGLKTAEVESIIKRFPAYFVFALNEEWNSRSEEYAILRDLETPFTMAEEKERRWLHYFSWLNKSLDEPMFYEAFGIRQIYIPLRGYGIRPIAGEEPTVSVFDLEKQLIAWVKNSDKDDAIRIVSGGPGSGKSSFVKLFASNFLSKMEFPVLLIPLHRFELLDDFTGSVGSFVKNEGFLKHNPIDPLEGDSRLLIILDGLDELTLQGKYASEVASDLIRKVQRHILHTNVRKTCLQVIISGRELIVQSNLSELKSKSQILKILPYNVKEFHYYLERDQSEVLAIDQRDEWWRSYGKATKRWYKGLPDELSGKNLEEITTQPLLNYLLSLSYKRKKLDFSKDLKLNLIYEDLLKAVYERSWAPYQHPSIKGVNESQFIRVLEEIAVSAWYGDGRTTTVNKIEEQCEESGLKPYLVKFEESAKKGLTRLLTAFYFRESGRSFIGERVFEFTHKSFGEYLTSRRIINTIKNIHDEIELKKINIDRGYNENDALIKLSKLCRHNLIDRYLLEFLTEELRLQNTAEVSKWQDTLSSLLSYILRHDLPMEKLQIKSFREEQIQARNSAEALICVLYLCASHTKSISKIEWSSKMSFGEFISLILGQREPLVPQYRYWGDTDIRKDRIISSLSNF